MTDELPKLRLLQNIVAFDFSEQHDETTIARYCPHADYAIISCGKLSLDEARAKIELCHRAGARFVLATRGAHGALFSDGSTIYMKAAIRIDARDSLGAGDAYLTAFLLCFVPWEAISGQVATKTERYSAVARAMQDGNTFASAVCMQDGAFGYGAPIA
jgi:fructoselysine 6-kinase